MSLFQVFTRMKNKNLQASLFFFFLSFFLSYPSKPSFITEFSFQTKNRGCKKLVRRGPSESRTTSRLFRQYRAARVLSQPVRPRSRHSRPKRPEEDVLFLFLFLFAFPFCFADSYVNSSSTSLVLCSVL